MLSCLMHVLTSARDLKEMQAHKQIYLLNQKINFKSILKVLIDIKTILSIIFLKAVNLAVLLFFAYFFP